MGTRVDTSVSMEKIHVVGTLQRHRMSDCRLMCCPVCKKPRLQSPPLRSREYGPFANVLADYLHDEAEVVVKGRRASIYVRVSARARVCVGRAMS
jgi:hypothetical protein